MTALSYCVWCGSSHHTFCLLQYPLLTAVKEGNIVLIRQLIEKGADLNEIASVRQLLLYFHPENEFQHQS